MATSLIQVLLTDGHRLTTTRVAERAGVSVGTMYQYFPLKQALLYALVQQHMTAYAEAFEASCVDHHETPIKSMAEAIVVAFIDMKIREPDVSRALYRIAAELDTDELRVDMSRRLQDACSALLASATDVRFEDLPDISFTLLTAMNGTMRAHFESSDRKPRVAMLRKQLLALCGGYLLTVASSATEEEVVLG